MPTYEVYATVTGKIYLGDYEGRNRIEAARNALKNREELLKSNVEVEGLFDVVVTPYDSIEVK